MGGPRTLNSNKREARVLGPLTLSQVVALAPTGAQGPRLWE